MLSLAALFLENYGIKRKFTCLVCYNSFSSSQHRVLVLSTIELCVII